MCARLSCTNSREFSYQISLGESLKLVCCCFSILSQEPTSIEVQETYQTENIVEQQEEHVERSEVQEHIECQSYVAEVSSQTFVTTTTMTSTTTTSEEQVLSFEELAADATGEPLNEELIAEEVKVQEDEISVVSSAMAEQLANVQTQLLALSHLPRTIQSTLDEIAKQLEALIPPKLKQKSVEPEIKVEEEFVVVTSEGKLGFNTSVNESEIMINRHPQKLRQKLSNLRQQ